MFSVDLYLDEIEATDALGAEAERRVRAACINGVERGLRTAVSYARVDHTYRDRTGALTASIASNYSTGPAGASGHIEATAPHASFVEQGTKPHMIWPKAGEGTVGPVRQGQSRRTSGDIGTHRVALRWFEEGSTKPRFARFVRHPGTAPMPFIGPASEVAGEVILGEVDKLGPELQRLFGGT